jgi:hypothetical protein
LGLEDKYLVILTNRSSLGSRVCLEQSEIPNILLLHELSKKSRNKSKPIIQGEARPQERERTTFSSTILNEISKLTELELEPTQDQIQDEVVTQRISNSFSMSLLSLNTRNK